MNRLKILILIYYVAIYIETKTVSYIPLTYPFSCRNEKYDFLKQIKKWHKTEQVRVKNPVYWPGENGKGVEIPEHLKEESEKRFKENQFNVVASELIALDRSIPDLRWKEYDKQR